MGPHHDSTTLPRYHLAFQSVIIPHSWMRIQDDPYKSKGLKTEIADVQICLYYLPLTLTFTMSSKLSILHFNDVYRVTPQRFSPTSEETIDVTQFSALIEDIRAQWAERSEEGLLLFSGDVFSPSVESSVTRGSHMVPVLNSLAVDVTVVGNHDFDFGYPHLSKLVKDTEFPWLLSNIIDSKTTQVPDHLKEFFVLEKAGVRIGFIGLVEEAWIATVPSWPPEFRYTSMTETSIRLSKLLRDPQGPYRCDLIIALTHCRLPNDIVLAKGLLALSPSSQGSTPISSEHGVDLILGGHDHLYFVSRGVDDWENFDNNERIPGAEADEGDILIVKSGSDFRDLSEMSLELRPTSPGSVRTKVIRKITGKRHEVVPGMRSSKPLADLLKSLLSSVDQTLKAPLCRTDVRLDVRSIYIRLEESPICDWFSDIIRHAYDESPCLKECGGSDGALACAGTFRGDSVYGPGYITMGDVLEILPFGDPIIILELDGATLWDTLENSLAKWPALEGRFPAISGFRVEWDSTKAPGERVLGVWLLKPNVDMSGFDDEEIRREEGGRRYKIVTREYLAQGHDGFDPLTRGKWLTDHECGSTFASIVRSYLLGSQFVNKFLRVKDEREAEVSSQTREFIDGLKVRSGTIAEQRWKRAAEQVLEAQSRTHYREHIQISMTEHMSPVDAFDGANVRKGLECKTGIRDELVEDLLLVSPRIDGRLKDVARTKI